MRHLTEETLARLVDEKPTEEEESHIRACSACARRLRELKEQTEALASLPALRPPSDDWDRLEARLRREGLVGSPHGGEPAGEGGADARPDGPPGAVPTVFGPAGRSIRRFGSSWAQGAAALVLFLGGTAFGSWMDGDAASPEIETTADTGTVEEAPALDDAAARVRSAEERYVDALVTYRNLLRSSDGGTDGLDGSEDPAARVAALEALVAASQEAIRQAPADPFFNGVLASTMAERQAAIRQISSSADDSWF